ncbi:MAG: DUF5610 domain-containing protein [Candidatus Accumulibacter sp.]|jgi:hypothetical protein|nr:DUF5610 domain-containing protein [Accumulibacter sp.]
MITPPVSTSSQGGAYTAQAAAQRNARAEEQDKTQSSGKLGAGALAEQSRYQASSQILQASFSISISAGEQSQTLLFRSAIDRINERLETEVGANALQNPAVPQDYSPEATAGRILSFSTGFYDAYARQHPGEDPETLAQNFVDVIRSGFERGFDDAKNILQGLRAFSGNVEAGVMRTYELVSQGYDQFLSNRLAALRPPAETTGPGGAPAEQRLAI